MEKKYNAIRLQQRPEARPMYLLAVDAPEILEWADVPRKKSQYMAGYQRQLDDRHKKLSAFIKQDPRNIVPGAVIVALRSEAVTVSGDGEVVELTIGHEERSVEELLQDALDGFRARLSDSELASIESYQAETVPEEFESPEEESPEEEAVAPESYLARLTAELVTASTKGLAELPAERQAAVREYLLGTSKPGLILDGQHRIFAAKNIDDFDVKIPVVALPGLPTSEQVFQFYVLNNKAKPLKPTELRATISTSLSNAEITELYTRFKSAGVRSNEAGWTHRMNTDEVSPFRGLLDFGFADGKQLIPENVAFQVAKQFMKPAKRFRMLFKDVEQWKDDAYKLRLFYAVWSTVQSKYPQAWVDAVKGSNRQIHFKATMICLQELLLESLTKGMPRKSMQNQPSPFADPEELAKEVEVALWFLPEEFFTKEWQETGLDTKERRAFLKGQMEAAINKQGQGLGHLQLLKKKSKDS